MWTVVWVTVFIVSGEAHHDTLTQQDSYPTQEQCLAHVTKYQDRMPDYVRGFENIDFDDDVKVVGGCKIDGKGA